MFPLREFKKISRPMEIERLEARRDRAFLQRQRHRDMKELSRIKMTGSSSCPKKITSESMIRDNRKALHKLIEIENRISTVQSMELNTVADLNILLRNHRHV